MSVALTKQTITGSELPVTSAYSYTTNLDNGGVYLLKIDTPTNGSPGYFDLKRQLINPFPPTSFTESMVTHRQSIFLNGCTDISLLKLANFPKHSFANNLNLYPVGTYNGYGVFGGGVTSYKPSCVEMSNVRAGVASTFVLDYFFAHALGQESNGEPSTVVRIANGQTISESSITSFPLNLQYLEITNNITACYGVCFISTTAYVLLKQNGTFAKITSVHNPSSATTTYGVFTVPSGGKIKQFKNGYYLATDSLDALFLYSINNGGELITELTGTFNPSLTPAFFDVI